jgi:serine phosphatase RsbU (regulator of sigma subunit)
MFLNNDLTIYKGVRRSIGDQTHENNMPDFVNIEYKGNPNDTIYLFSDGYPDQFGGKHGKKFMTSSIKEMLIEIHKKPMKEQYNIVKNTYINWKDYHDQVDDVIFIGIRL